MKAPKDQHFLVDAQAVALIADTVPVSGRKVLEIGPGGGVLTAALLGRGAVVRAVELDGTLLPNLQRRFSDQIASGRLEIIRGDASKVPLPEFELVVANLPYSISSKITFRLLEIGFESAVLMYQLEFGKRMIAPPGSGEYGRLSVMAQTYADVEMVLELPPEAFSPPPEVWSIVVKITPHEPPVPIRDRSVHAVLVRELFSHRRKTIRNGLRSMRSIYGESVMTNLVENLPAEMLEMRPEMLSVPDFINLANRLSALIP
ncbi:MAG: 16S rRNA (adenine(1518)-N(6)/adenine(1519)-N(6))-dimethyltransferase RsmA [Methanocorpusculum sp.]|nr:16S rRNA (adenine(1518)-N(6)/adenine(1519)-N(6))-dimethyltransferase RsmA [Methanocorpusculum sp.]MDE2522241.1 16S rRNA (adenine(1518)-N(6)/adenine(1519)-N(6))-dimethyltransferase RsmA [Methanocorpusculum sp.]MDE2525399.1 16S rRNA (adenine(1518)-N(6)/adenine(1519)-N(6))-dimethyltransferase RsmA [Methanocorpusculum sp.]